MFRSRKTVKEFVALMSIPFMFSIFVIYSYHTSTETEIYMYLKRHSATRKHLKPRISSSGKIELLLFVGIHSAPSRLDRRNAMRETWMKECQSNSNAVCRFFTDGQEPNGQALQGEKRIKLENERRVHEDLLLTEVPGGVNFAVKYLWMLQWAKERYDFQYFLRLDDDYFICFDKLMLELEIIRPREKFQWGWLHCDRKVTEAFGCQ
ncbi:beta-1,3-galactosyltransferase 6-like, partial [Paramuricea clavata]